MDPGQDHWEALFSLSGGWGCSQDRGIHRRGEPCQLPGYPPPGLWDEAAGLVFGAQRSLSGAGPQGDLPMVGMDSHADWSVGP